MPEYLDIDVLPAAHNRHWVEMLDEFQQIPMGKMLDITERLDGTKAASAATALRHTLQMQDVQGLRVMRRGDRLFVMRPEEAQR